MGDRLVLFRIDQTLFSTPFEVVDEIVGRERVTDRGSLPDDVPSGDNDSDEWVYAGGDWFPLNPLIPGLDLAERIQVVVLRYDGKGRAFFVDQVIGIEALPPLRPIPGPVLRCTDFPLSGFRVWNGKIVFDLDLSRPI